MQIELIYLVYLLIALQVLDAITTIYALERDGSREANPVMRKLFQAVGLVPGMLLVKAVYLAFIWHYWAGIDYRVFVALCGLYVWIVGNNLNVIRKLKQA